MKKCFLLGMALTILAHAEDVIHIPRVNRPPRMEDFLEGTPREAEAVVSAFLQRAPHDGDPVTQPTTAYLSYDEKRLYVVFVCHDDPTKVRARLAPREDIYSDDIVGIYLDTFHDRQRAYVFASNALGVQGDTISTEGQEDDGSWDAVWDSKGRLTVDGYIVWMAIPFRELRFSNAQKQTWGIGLTRWIQRTNEDSYWPRVTPTIQGLVTQFGTLEGIEGISAPGHNAQFIPYGSFTGSKALDENAPQGPMFRSKNEPRLGMDTKLVIHDAFTLDVTLNPDFSQVESDDPQVRINQRFEVFFPEKRPFFVENAGFFQTPENLFFSRRIADPQFGARLTGKLNGWTLGVLAIDDRLPGENLLATDPLNGRRAINGALRVRREFANKAAIGLLVTSRDFASTSNRVFALDARVPFGPSWVLTAQAIRTYTREAGGYRRAGPGYRADLMRSGLNWNYAGSYLDRSPNFESDLGFIQRVDIRQTSHMLGWTFHPTGKRLLSYGPRVSTLGDWTRTGRVQDWFAGPGFDLEFSGATKLSFDLTRSFELFSGAGFQKWSRAVTFSSDWQKWFGVAATYSSGRGVNYFPGTALAELIPAYGADFGMSSLTVTLRPARQLRLDEIYLYSRLGTGAAGSALVPSGTTIFNNHVIRSKLNYQFTRSLSARVILDYGAVLPNQYLVAQDRSKRFSGDFLLRYLPSPGTAVYVGYTRVYENLGLTEEPLGMLFRTNDPTRPTARQFFVKMSFLLHL